MIRVLVLYYSSAGHVEELAYATASGARAAGAAVDVRRVPERPDESGAGVAGKGRVQEAPVATMRDLDTYDALVVGTEACCGRMPTHVAAFLDQAEAYRGSAGLGGKVAAAFTSAGGDHCRQEATLFSIIANLMHLGMVIVGAPPPRRANPEPVALDDRSFQAGWSGIDAATMPSRMEIEAARHQGELVVRTARKLSG